MKRAWLFSIVVLATVELSGAHEFWIEPETYRTKSDAVVRIGLKLGERFLGETMVRDESLIERFVVLGPDGEQAVVGRSGAATSFVRLYAPGLHILAYRSHRRPSEVSPRQFEAYLREEGLSEIIGRRAALGETDRPGREVFSRCAKALVCVGDSAGEGHDRVVGLPLEIVPELNPLSLQTGAELPLRILFQGSPLPGATVVLACRDRPRTLYTALTDADGRVEVELPMRGICMATTIHMIRAPAGIDADWESFWASLTFELPQTRDSGERIGVDAERP